MQAEDPKPTPPGTEPVAAQPAGVTVASPAPAESQAPAADPPVRSGPPGIKPVRPRRISTSPARAKSSRIPWKWILGALAALILMAAPVAWFFTRPDPVQQAQQEAAFLADLVSTLNDGDGEFLDAHVHYPALLRLAMKNMAMDDDTRDAIVNQGSETLRIGKVLAQSVRTQKAWVHLISTNQTGDRHLATFRVLGATSLNYFKLTLRRLPDGDFEITDLFSFRQGEWLSQSARRSVLTWLVVHQAAPPRGLTADEQQILAHTVEINAIVNGVRYPELHSGVAEYAALPKALQEDRYVLFWRLQQAKAAEPDEFARYAALIQRLFPDSPEADLQTLDPDFLAGRYEQVLAALDRLDAAVGHDPHLDAMRANCFARQNKPDQACVAARRAIDQEKTDNLAHEVLIYAALAQNQPDQVASAIEQYQTDLGVWFRPNVITDQWQAFLASDAGQKMLARHDQRLAATPPPPTTTVAPPPKAP